MTITFPRDLPAGNIWRDTCRMTPLYAQVAAPTRGGLVQVANIGRDRWGFQFETVPLIEPQAHEVAAWVRSLRGGVRLFKARFPLRDYLIAYPSGYGGMTRSGGGAFDGTATLSAVGATLDTVSLSTLPAGLVFKAGDLLSIAYASGVQGLHEVMEPETAGGGGAVTLTVEPTVLPGFAIGATVRLAQPFCLAVLDSRSQAPVRWSTGRPGTRRGVVAFSAVQTFLAA